MHTKATGTPTEFRWLGVAGIELKAADQILVIDPYFTRFPAWRMWLGRVQPNRELIAERIPHCDSVLVTHAHFDHIMDVPNIAGDTGATVYGSANSCRLVALCGVPEEKIQGIKAGDRLNLESFQVEVRSAKHRRAPGFLPGPLASDLEPPLRARDYRMDDCLSFLVSVQGLRLLTDPGARPSDAAAADLLFVFPGMDRSYYEALLELVQPRVVIPIHWDDFFRSLSRPLRPFWKLPRVALPPLQRTNLARFKQMMEQLAPGVTVLEPEILRPYDLGKFKAASSQEAATGCTGGHATRAPSVCPASLR
jgi:L-ascorbate metabolism protein UlaG (beta-lactamase superfamily)